MERATPSEVQQLPSLSPPVSLSRSWFPHCVCSPHFKQQNWRKLSLPLDWKENGLGRWGGEGVGGFSPKKKQEKGFRPQDSCRGSQHRRRRTTLLPCKHAEAHRRFLLHWVKLPAMTSCRLRRNALRRQRLLDQPWLSGHLPKPHSLRMGHYRPRRKTCHRPLLFHQHWRSWRLRPELSHTPRWTRC